MPGLGRAGKCMPTPGTWDCKFTLTLKSVFPTCPPSQPHGADSGSGARGACTVWTREGAEAVGVYLVSCWRPPSLSAGDPKTNHAPKGEDTYIKK